MPGFEINIEPRIAPKGPLQLELGCLSAEVQVAPSSQELLDEHGAFGTPASYSTRTMVQPATRRLLLVFFNFGGQEGLRENLEGAAARIAAHCQGKNMEIWQK